MNARERLIRTIKFQSVDRIPLVEWPIREATMREWLKQGYPKGCNPQEYFSTDTMWIGAPFDIRISPKFEEKIIEQNDRYKIWTDDLGALRKDFIDNENPGFVTRSWLKFPVESRTDFNEIKKRYNHASPERFADDFIKNASVLNDSPSPVMISIPFLFWTARDWMGFENLCMAFYDEPLLLHAMFEFITDFSIEVLRKAYEHIHIDLIELEEDMAYKGAPMVSPALFKEFMFPHYRRLVDFAKSNGTEIIMVDCDGYPGGLIPHWIDAGADAMSPCEIAAGVDIIKTRDEYPGFGLLGGIDKRELSKTKIHIYNEVISKVPQMITKGGFVPHVDHAVPFNVSLENYTYFRQLMSEIAYGKSPEIPKE